MGRHKSKNVSGDRKGAQNQEKAAENKHKQQLKQKNRPPSDMKENNDIPIMSTQETCDLIAELSESILEDPSTAFFSSKHAETDETIPSKMQQLQSLASDTRNEYTARLAVMSLLALYQDVLPSYRIRLPTQQEMAVRVSKETMQLWKYERALLQHYQQYLKLLERTWWRNKHKGNATPSPLAITAILSLCELLKSALHFNFRSNILQIVVRQMNNKQCVEVGDACCDAVTCVFQHDAQGDIALEATRLVAKMCKERNFNVRPAVLQTFLSLPLRVHSDEAQAAKLAAAAQAKKRKRNKEEAEIESELKEGSTSVDKILLARSQSDTLQAVTLTYFRILKSDDLQTSTISELLPPALEGLAKFAHLINFETVVDLLEVLKTLLKRVDELPLEASLNCILTAFSTLQGPGRELKIDVKEYITPLYTQLPRLCTEANNSFTSNTTNLVLQCLNAAFIKRREYSTVRLAAFYKALCTIALHAPPTTSAPLLAFCRQLSQRYPSLQQMLENEQDVITSGKYNPDVEDPEHANPFATSAWELATLKFHYHSQVAHHANGAANQKLLQLPFEAPERVRKEMVRDAKELYIASRRVSKKHPLTGRSGGDSTNGKRQRAQERFIKPQQKESYHLR